MRAGGGRHNRWSNVKISPVTLQRGLTHSGTHRDTHRPPHTGPHTHRDADTRARARRRYTHRHTLTHRGGRARRARPYTHSDTHRDTHTGTHRHTLAVWIEASNSWRSLFSSPLLGQGNGQGGNGAGENGWPLFLSSLSFCSSDKQMPEWPKHTERRRKLERVINGNDNGDQNEEKITTKKKKVVVVVVVVVVEGGGGGERKIWWISNVVFLLFLSSNAVRKHTWPAIEASRNDLILETGKQPESYTPTHTHTPTHTRAHTHR